MSDGAESGDDLQDALRGVFQKAHETHPAARELALKAHLCTVCSLILQPSQTGDKGAEEDVKESGKAT